MIQFLRTVCRTSDSCENLITLDPGPEQCETCADEEQREALMEQEEEKKRYKDVEHEIHRSHLEGSMKYESESDSSNSDRPLKYTIKKVKKEYDELMPIGLSDGDSAEEQEENVTSTTAITTTTTTTTGSTTLSFTGPLTPFPTASKMPTGPPQEWSVEAVIKFIADTDPALAVHAELFRKHVSLVSQFFKSNISF